MRIQITNRIIDFICIYSKFSKTKIFLILLLVTYLILFYKMKPHTNPCTSCFFIKLIDFHWNFFCNRLSNYIVSYWFCCRRPSRRPQWSYFNSLIRYVNLRRRRNRQKIKNLLLASNLSNYPQHSLQSQKEYKISIDLIIIAVLNFFPFSY